ncbi:MAG: thioredoxin domain-containing protein [Thermoleophilia bacterium]|nr:thioredoxin domain-containing protein [Thermoleophilia bacterium]
MATGPQQKRKELREKRLKAEAQAKGGDRRENLMKIVGVAAFVAIIAIIGVVFALSKKGDDSPAKDSSSVSEQLAGIPQNGSVLGDPKAKVTLVEFGDLQCPICKQYADEILPDVIAGPIKSGKANFEFKNWAVLGADSTLAAKAALAAGEQNLAWSYLENFYANQELENTGYVTDDFMTDIAEKAGIKDIDKWNVDREKPDLENVLLDIDNEAIKQGFSGTPSFAIRDSKGKLTPIDDTQTSQAIIDAINKAQ